MSEEIIEAIKFLPAPELGALAGVLGTLPSVEALQRMCTARPAALETVRRYIYCPRRATTPPRARIQVPETPPPVVRLDRARRPMHPKPPLYPSPAGQH